MIIEFLTMKITFDAILDHVNSIAYQQELQERVRILKSRLLKLTSEYSTGAISKKEFDTREAEIMSEINSMIKQITSAGDATRTQTSSDLGGLGGLL